MLKTVPVRGVGTAADADRAVVLADDLLADPEAEAGAGGFFGGEEGLEDVAAGFLRDAAAGIADGDADA